MVMDKSIGIVNIYSESVNLGRFRFILPASSEVHIEDDRVDVNLVSPRFIDVEDALKDLLYDAVKQYSNSQVVFASGGIDSSILAKILDEFNHASFLMTAGTEGSEDLYYGRILANSLGKRLIEVKLDKEQILKTIKELKRLRFSTYDIILGIVEYNLLSFSEQLNLNPIMTGAGSDEIFLGYHNYKGLSQEETEKYRMLRVFRLGDTDILRMNILAKHFNKQLNLPYLDHKIISYAFKFVKQYDGKARLRKLAEMIGLPKELIERSKKAMQYGSGVVETLEDLAKEKGFYSIPSLIREV